MNCKHCNYLLKEGQTFCPNCGKSVNNETTAEITTQSETSKISLKETKKRKNKS